MPEYRFLFKKTSVQPRSTAAWKASKSLEDYISKYQDEAGKKRENLKRGRNPEQEGPEPAPPGGKKKRGQWRNPLTHETGTLWAGGFFGNRRSPGRNCPRKQKKWIREFVREWTFKARGMPKRKNEGSRMVLAISDKTIEELTACGIPADLAAQEILGQGMALYAKRHGWAPGSLGWLAGFHHDNGHLHMHVLLFPTTKNGEPLRLSNRNEKEGEIRDDLVDITGAMNVAAEIYYQTFLPYRVQSPEVKLAWFRDQTAPVPKIEDYRVENPLPMKYMVPEEKEEIRRKKREAESRKKRAQEALALEANKNPQRERELQSGAPVKLTGRETPLDKLTRLWIREKAKESFVEATKGEKDVSPESKDPEKAARAIMLLSAQMPMANHYLGKIEEDIQNGIQTIGEAMEANRRKAKGTLIEKALQKIQQGWTNAKLGHMRWRLQKILEKVQEPDTRARILSNLHMAYLQSTQQNNMVNTETGLEDLRQFARGQALEYQKTAETLTKTAKTDEEAGERLLKNLRIVEETIPRAKKEMAWTLTLKATLRKIPGEKKAAKEIDFLSLGARLRLKAAQDEKETRRSRIRLQGSEKTPLPARTGEKISRTEGRTKETGFHLLRLPSFLDPKKIGPLIESKLQELRERPQEPSAEVLEPETPKTDPLQKWKDLGEKSSLKEIFLELQRRRGKEK